MLVEGFWGAIIQTMFEDASWAKFSQRGAKCMEWKFGFTDRNANVWEKGSLDNAALRFIFETYPFSHSSTSVLLTLGYEWGWKRSHCYIKRRFTNKISFVFGAGNSIMAKTWRAYRPSWRYFATLQMTEYRRIHLINSSNRNCGEIRWKSFFYARFLPERNFQLSTELVSCVLKKWCNKWNEYEANSGIQKVTPKTSI